MFTILVCVVIMSSNRDRKARVRVSYKFLWKSCDPVGGEDDDRTGEGIVKKCDKSNH